MPSQNSSLQRSWWKLAIHWLKLVLQSPLVFRLCLLALRISVEIHRWLNNGLR